MGTPLGDFVRAKRDSIQPESFGIPDRGRRRSPGLRRSDLAARAGVSVEYLTRIEQGRDRNPSQSVLNALADALSLDAGERQHLRYLAKITGGGTCVGRPRPEPLDRDVRPTVLATLQLVDPGVAYVANRLGDVLAFTTGFELVMRGSGLLEADAPNLTRYVFTDPRAREIFPDWGQLADERAFDLWFGPSIEISEWFTAELAPLAGEEFTRRLNRHLPPPRVPLRINQASGYALCWHRETLELPATDGQVLVVLLPADDTTEQAMDRLRRRPLRAIG
ncbi:helix-turn-helix domain-containing protein [Asanoa iriomotensis]|uniref:HTH cro/C1-type domain-containing protein n=1 Tax=Asanoa iriomotensis TaxID=234613 RepID=A0ABQ4CDM0_9ACTN|nr:helix-turn-helix transcriptional regulator [Asanoa iriomotensis]GIF60875.1 hypothetical protein Air01nite_69700 [Asanoa iriomotensis]